MDYILEKGAAYIADVKLTWLQNVATNEDVADKFRELGFTEVVVTGSGRNRQVSGMWNGQTQKIQVPDSVRNVVKLQNKT